MCYSIFSPMSFRQTLLAFIVQVINVTSLLSNINSIVSNSCARPEILWKGIRSFNCLKDPIGTLSPTPIAWTAKSVIVEFEIRTLKVGLYISVNVLFYVLIFLPECGDLPWGKCNELARPPCLSLSPLCIISQE